MKFADIIIALAIIGTFTSFFNSLTNTLYPDENAINVIYRQCRNNGNNEFNNCATIKYNMERNIALIRTLVNTIAGLIAIFVGYCIPYPALVIGLTISGFLTIFPSLANVWQYLNEFTKTCILGATLIVLLLTPYYGDKIMRKYVRTFGVEQSSAQSTNTSSIYH